VRLLAYFGERGTACGNCDTCVDPPETWDATAAAQKALSAIYRTGQRFGAVHLIDVLRGRETERVMRWDHHRLAVFGVGSDVDDATWRSVFRQLVALGIALVDHAGHGALHLTPASRPVLRGEQAVQMRRLRTVSRSAKKTRGMPSGLGAADAELLGRLKAWRLQQSRDQGVPAYVVLHDSTLAEIARQRPRDLAALARVPGIGAKKLERYGAGLLDAIDAA
jgi:ATP-dependent DNA helicase RecQ